MFNRIIVLLILLILEKTLCSDQICKLSTLREWNEKVDNISAAVRIFSSTEPKPRKIPLCIGMSNNNTEPWNLMKHFMPIFDDIKVKENLESYEVGLSTDKSGRSPLGFVERILFSRITVPERSMTNLRQWVHIQFKIKSLQGIIVQSICMPLGLPCGEFKVYPDINCPDCFHMRYDYMFQAPCLYRPKASVIHPHAWVFKSEDVPRNELHTNFIWIDAMCQEMLSVQFLIVAVKSFSNKIYEVFYSPVYSNLHQDGKEGSPYLWVQAAFAKNTKCHGGDQTCSNCKKTDPIKLGVDRRIGAILPYNIEYDDCIKNNAGVNNECPPGPFKCYVDRNTTSYSLKGKGIILGETLEKYREGLIPHMLGCPPKCVDPDEQRKIACNMRSTKTPNDEATMGRKFSIPLYTEFLKSSVLLKRAENRSHGALMIFACFVLTTSSIFISRFLKESAGIAGSSSCLGMAWWLWAHVLITFFTLGIMWMGIASITYELGENPYTCKGLMNYVNKSKLAASDEDVLEMDKLCKSAKSLRYLHRTVGYISIILLYVETLIGWVRPMMKSLRSCSISIHAFLGYFSIIVAAITVVTSHVCLDIKLISVVGIVVLNFLLIFFVTFCQIFIDTRYEVDRSMCPVPGVNEIGPCGLMKAMTTFFQCVLTLIMYFLIVYSYQAQRDFQDKNEKSIFFSETVYHETRSKKWCPFYGADIVVGTILSEFWE